MEVIASTSPAVLRALGPISQPMRPAPSCTGALIILNFIVPFPVSVQGVLGQKSGEVNNMNWQNTRF
jgi:hypothetical protein